MAKTTHIFKGNKTFRETQNAADLFPSSAKIFTGLYYYKVLYYLFLSMGPATRLVTIGSCV